MAPEPNSEQNDMVPGYQFFFLLRSFSIPQQNESANCQNICLMQDCENGTILVLGQGLGLCFQFCVHFCYYSSSGSDLNPSFATLNK